MYDLLIPLLAFVTVMALGGALVMTWAARRLPLQARLHGGGSDQALDGSLPADSPLTNGLAKLGRSLSAGRASNGLRQQLARAGYHDRSAAAVYLGLKLVLLVLGAAGAGMLVHSTTWPLASQFLMIVTAGALLSFVPNVVVHLRQQERSLQVRRCLPDAVDLLEICVSSGMGLDMAWNAVTDEIRRVSPVLADEMALTNLEIHLGAPRAEAMRHMAQRTGADELSSLVAVLVQSERFGTSVADALRTFAAAMRETRSQHAEEAAEKMAVKLLFPMVLFIFPVVIIVAAGPAAIHLRRLLFQD